MISSVRRTDVPVLLVHNVDPLWQDADIKQALEDVCAMREALIGEGHPVVDLKITSPDLPDALSAYDPEQYIVLNWCEELPGCPKTDADVAAILSCLGYTYTGSSPEVLKRSWEKTAVKHLLNKQGVSTPVGKEVAYEDADRWETFPAIVKPSREHCSIGLTADAVVSDAAALRERIEYVERALKQPALVEDFIDGREFHVSIWGNGEIEVFPPAEMDFSAFSDWRRHLCTYDSKFLPGSEDFESIQLVVPADLDEIQNHILKQSVCRSYRAMGCRDYARIDLRLRKDTFYVLDVNPNADLSPETSTVYAAASRGMTYGQFASGLVNLAARRHPVYGLSG